MATRRITVSTTTVYNTGDKIVTDKAVDYKSIYSNMFSKMESLNGTWNGTDFSEFAKKARSFKEDFDAMGKVLIEYGEYLKKAAKAYETAQENALKDANSNLKS